MGAPISPSMGRGRSSSPLAPPPWKKPPLADKLSKKGAEVPLSKGSPSPTSTDMELDHTAVQEAVAGPSLALLKPLYEQLLAACGPDAPVCQDLKKQVQALEEAELPRELPLHVQVSKAERRLCGLHKNLARLEISLDRLEEKKLEVENDIMDIKVKGQECLAQIAAIEHDKAIAVSTMAQQSCLGGAAPGTTLHGIEVDLQKAAEFEQCRPLLQQMELLVAKIRDACGEAAGLEIMLPTQMQGSVTPVASPQAEDETQPGLPSFGPPAVRGSRFRVSPYPGPEATTKEEIYSGRDLGLEGASASEFDAKQVDQQTQP